MTQTGIHSLPYRRDIDGLRGLAVLLVVCFHFAPLTLVGGYVGVDVFFVISGYLITQVILKGLAEESFTFRGFYLRRVRRIFPALFALLFCCAAVAAVLYPPQELRDFGVALSSVSLFGGNILFSFLGKGGYFGAFQRPGILMHTWSLGVEEQFYILYPLLLVAVMRWRKRFLVPCLCALLVLSLASSVWWAHVSQTGAFFLLPPRAWELLLGALLAVLRLEPVRSRAVREALGILGLLFIVAAALTFYGGFGFSRYALPLPTVGAALLLWAGEGRSFAGALLRSKPMVGLGLISYSLYLWHWPVVCLERYIPCIPQNFPLSKGRIVEGMVASVLLAIFSYRFIEQPFRSSRSRVSDRAVIRLAPVTIVLVCLIGAGFVATHGLAQRYSSRTRDLLTANTLAHDEAPSDDRCNNLGKQIESYSDFTFCKFGDAPKNVLLWGDSHAGMLVPLLLDMQKRGQLQGRGVVLAIAPGCPPAQHMGSAAPHTQCDLRGRFTLQRALLPDIDTVFIQFYPWWNRNGIVCAMVNGRCVQRLSATQAHTRFLADLTDNIDTLKASGKKVVLGMPFPIYSQDIPDLQIRRIMLGRFAPHPVAQLQEDTWRQPLLELAAKEQIGVFDARKTLCSGKRCTYEAGGVSLLRDYEHITTTGIYVLKENLADALNGAAH